MRRALALVTATIEVEKEMLDENGQMLCGSRHTIEASGIGNEAESVTKIEVDKFLAAANR